MKRFKRIGSKSTVIIVRVSETMDSDIERVATLQEISKSDFVRIAVSNAIKFYSKKHYAMMNDDYEIQQFLRDSKLAMTRKEQEQYDDIAKPRPQEPSDDEIAELLNRRKDKLENSKAG